MFLEKKDTPSSQSRNESDNNEKYRDSDDESYRDDHEKAEAVFRSSIILNPAEANMKERLWIEAMSDGVELRVAERFERWVPSYPAFFNSYIIGSLFLVTIYVGFINTSTASKPLTRFCIEPEYQGES